MKRQTIGTIIYGVLLFTVLALQYSAFVVDHFLTLNGNINEGLIQYKLSVTFKSHKCILRTFNKMLETNHEEEIVYADRCENALIESEKEKMCQIDQGGTLHTIANSVVAFLIILLMLLIVCKPIKLRFIISGLSLILGGLLITTYVLTLVKIKASECVLAAKLKETAGPAAAYILDEKRFCLNSSDSYLTLNVERSLKLSLSAGAILSFVAVTYWIMIDKLSDQESEETQSKADISKYDAIDHEEMMQMTHTTEQDEEDPWWD